MAAIGNALADDILRDAFATKDVRKASGRSSALETFSAGRSATRPPIAPPRDDRGARRARRRDSSRRGSPGSTRSAPRPSATGRRRTSSLPPPDGVRAERRPRPGDGRLGAGRRRGRLPRAPRPTARRAARSRSTTAAGDVLAVPHGPYVDTIGERRRGPRGTRSRALCLDRRDRSAPLSAPVRRGHGPRRPGDASSRSTVDAGRRRSAGSSGRGGRSSARSTSRCCCAARARAASPRRRRAGRGVPDRARRARRRARPRPRHPPRRRSASYREVDGGAALRLRPASTPPWSGCSRPGCGRSSSCRSCPRDLAADPESAVFDYRGIISPPRDLEALGDLVERARPTPRRAVRPRRGRARGRSRSGTSPTSGCSGPAASPTYFDLYDAIGRGGEGGRPGAPRRRAVDGGRRLGRRPARPRGDDRRPGRLHHDPHVRRCRRSTCGRSSPAPAAPTCRCGGRSGASPDPRLAGQRQRLGRAARRARHALGGRAPRRAGLLGRLRPVRRARRARAAVPRRVRAADHRQPAQAAVLGAARSSSSSAPDELARRARRATARAASSRRGRAATRRRPRRDRALERHARPDEDRAATRRSTARSGSSSTGCRRARIGCATAGSTETTRTSSGTGNARRRRLAGRGRAGGARASRPARGRSSPSAGSTVGEDGPLTARRSTCRCRPSRSIELLPDAD